MKVRHTQRPASDTELILFLRQLMLLENVDEVVSEACARVPSSWWSVYLSTSCHHWYTQTVTLYQPDHLMAEAGQTGVPWGIIWASQIQLASLKDKICLDRFNYCFYHNITTHVVFIKRYCWFYVFSFTNEWFYNHKWISTSVLWPLHFRKRFIWFFYCPLSFSSLSLLKHLIKSCFHFPHHLFYS